MRYSLLGGGKRLRPVLILATAEALGLNLKYAQLRVRKQPSAKELPDQGAGREGQVEWTMGLQVTPKFQAQWKASA